MVSPVETTFTEIQSSRGGADFISPPFARGCNLDCSYCFVKNKYPVGVKFTEDVDYILDMISQHAKDADLFKPNLKDDLFTVYDISYYEDFALHSSIHNWRKIFEFFKEDENAKGYLSTKIIPHQFLKDNFHPHRKIRIVFPLMPQKLSNLLEPNTALIINRINAINEFSFRGYDVNISFSPVVVYPGWLEDYSNLFSTIDKVVNDDLKKYIKSEVTFLTHSVKGHVANLKKYAKGESYIWTPNYQEQVVFENGKELVRYKRILQHVYKKRFQELHKQIIPWNRLRSIN